MTSSGTKWKASITEKFHLNKSRAAYNNYGLCFWFKWFLDKNNNLELAAFP